MLWTQRIQQSPTLRALEDLGREALPSWARPAMLCCRRCLCTDVLQMRKDLLSSAWVGKGAITVSQLQWFRDIRKEVALGSGEP